MKKYLLIVFLSVFAFQAIGQEQQNIADLDFLYAAIKKMPSYNDQLKKDNSYERLYQNLRTQLHTSDELEVFKKLSKLIIPIRDNHLVLSKRRDSSNTFTRLKPEVDLDALEKKFENYPIDSLEGIYYTGGSKCVLYQNEDKSYYLQRTETKVLLAILFNNGFGTFDAIQFFNAPYFSYSLTKNVKLVDRYLIGLYCYKGSEKNLYSQLKRVKTYEYKELENDIGYLSLGSFWSSDQNIKKATEFLEQVKPAINVKNLIVDVRNNPGGGYKTSKQFINFLTRFKGNVYVLQNASTVSNAEQFILKLKENRQVMTLGEVTRGMITYGSNYGKTITLPSKRFIFYPTDMNGDKKELHFESQGIKPDVKLNSITEDWITQVVEIIKNK